MRARKNSGNKGGRLKKGDENYLLALWNGEVTMEKLKIEYDVELKIVIEDGEPVPKKIKTIKHFGSARDAFAYHCLKGDQTMLRDLTSKLYADKKHLEGDGEDGALKIEVVRWSESSKAKKD